jgi:hypothetical protein
VRNTPFVEPFMLKTTILPRQARDKQTYQVGKVEEKDAIVLRSRRLKEMGCHVLGDDDSPIVPMMVRQMQKEISFAMPFCTKMPSFYQDRLGTNIGKALKKEVCVVLQLYSAPKIVEFSRECLKR